MQNSEEICTTDVDVVIIGAGMAGLTAADHLFLNGINNVVILEASNRSVN